MMPQNPLIFDRIAGFVDQSVAYFRRSDSVRNGGLLFIDRIKGGERRFTEYPIALPDMAANVTDWECLESVSCGGLVSVPPWHSRRAELPSSILADVRDKIQTASSGYPKRVGPWKIVSHTLPFVIGTGQMLALAVTEADEVCGRYTGCKRVYNEVLVIAKHNTTSDAFDPVQRLTRDASPVAMQHMMIDGHDYLAVANGDGLASGYPLQRSGGGINIYKWNNVAGQFVHRQKLSTDIPRSHRRFESSPRALKHLYVADPGLHFLVVAFHSETSQTYGGSGNQIFDTYSFVYSWVPEGRTVMDNGMIDLGLGFQVTLQHCSLNTSRVLKHIYQHIIDPGVARVCRYFNCFAQTGQRISNTWPFLAIAKEHNRRCRRRSQQAWIWNSRSNRLVMDRWIY